MSEKIYPYQNLSWEDMEGEEWKGIPLLEKYYEVSNMGRIRRLAYVRKSKTGKDVFVKPKVLVQIKQTALNVFLNETRIYMRISPAMNGKTHNHRVGRLVYNAFVKPFNIRDKNFVIFYKDDDTLNNRADNLYLATQAEKQERMEKLGRMVPAFTNTSPEEKKEILDRIAVKKAKSDCFQISQYDLDGNWIKTFRNAREASRIVGLSQNFITQSSRKAYTVTAGGYLWAKGNAPKIDYKAYLKKHDANFSPLAKRHVMRVGQYDFDGNLINTYHTAKEAADAIGVLYGHMIDTLRGKHVTCKGYLWRKSIAKKLDLSKLLEEKGEDYIQRTSRIRQISQYTFDGVWVKTYRSFNEAKRATGIASGSIINAYRGRQLTAGGFLWREGTALRINVSHLTKDPNFDKTVLYRYIKKKKAAAREKKNAG
ncbi:NUMOD1 domain-containing protein [bacterium A37T11]|nr:NUMOD1 domain-containing protein [bacterium A37T11]